MNIPNASVQIGRLMNIVCVQTFPIDYCIDFVNAIAQLGTITLLAAERELAQRIDYVDPRIETVLLSWPRHRSLANVRLIAELLGHIRSRDADIVHFLGTSVSWLSLLPNLIRNRPVVVTVHDAERHPGDTQSQIVPMFLVDHFHRSATRLVVHGESIRTALARRSGRPISDIDIVPHVALNRYPELARRHRIAARAQVGIRRILFFGRVMTYKGLPYLLDAMILLRRDMPDLKLVIAGSGPAYEDVRHRLQAPHIEVHEGFVSDELVAQLFLDAELIVLPYIEASQSGILAMAAAFGRPVLVTDVGELGEVVRTTGMGLVVPPADCAALAAAMRHFFTKPGLPDELAIRSTAAATAGIFSPEHVAACSLKLYTAVLDAYRQSRRQSAIAKT